MTHYTDLASITEKYEVIYIDPPWEYSANPPGTYDTHFAADHYPLMSLVDLAAMPIKDITDKDCLMYMWVGSPILADAIELMTAWGFEYKTIAFVWYKQAPNVGYYTMSECEIVIVGKKKGGKIPQPRGSRNERQFLSKERTVHSEKPFEIRERITRMHPSQKKIEIFSRHTATGWDTFGNMTGDLDKLELPTDLFENFYS